MLHRKISFLLLIFSFSLNSQSLNDFLKISIDNPVGSARFESMGGAFGALGGDLSRKVCSRLGNSMMLLLVM